MIDDLMEVICMLLLLTGLASIALLLLEFLGDASFAQRLLLHTSVVAAVCCHGQIVILDHLSANLLPHDSLLLIQTEHLHLNDGLAFQGVFWGQIIISYIQMRHVCRKG